MAGQTFDGAIVKSATLVLGNPTTKAMSYVVEVYFWDPTTSTKAATTGALPAVNCAPGAQVSVPFSITTPTAEKTYTVFVAVTANSVVLSPVSDASQPITISIIPKATFVSITWS